MGNRRSRQLRLEAERLATWERLRAAPWRPDGRVRAFGSGLLRVQIIRLPSFDAASFWEVCELDTDWILYRSRVVDPGYPGPLTVQGYEPVTFASGELRGYFDSLVGLSLPIAPHLNHMAGVDGTLTQLTLFGDLDSSVRFEWWSDPPEAWKPLVRIADEMLDAFTRATQSEGLSETEGV